MTNQFIYFGYTYFLKKLLHSSIYKQPFLWDRDPLINMFKSWMLKFRQKVYLMYLFFSVSLLNVSSGNPIAPQKELGKKWTLLKKLEGYRDYSLIRGALIQSCYLPELKITHFTNFVCCHPQFSSIIQNIENHY